VGNDPLNKDDPTGRFESCGPDCIQSSTYDANKNKVPNLPISTQDANTILSNSDQIKGNHGDMKFVVGDKLISPKDVKTDRGKSGDS
jgi:hypothetical protein